jgi:hypothetical protein
MTEPEERHENVVPADVLDDVPLSAEESLDSDDLGDTDAGRDPLDDSWDAPDRPARRWTSSSPRRSRMSIPTRMRRRPEHGGSEVEKVQ